MQTYLKVNIVGNGFPEGDYVVALDDAPLTANDVATNGYQILEISDINMNGRIHHIAKLQGTGDKTSFCGGFIVSSDALFRHMVEGPIALHTAG